MLEEVALGCATKGFGEVEICARFLQDQHLLLAIEMQETKVIDDGAYVTEDGWRPSVASFVPHPRVAFHSGDLPNLVHLLPFSGIFDLADVEYRRNTLVWFYAHPAACAVQHCFKKGNFSRCTGRSAAVKFIDSLRKIAPDQPAQRPAPNSASEGSDSGEDSDRAAHNSKKNVRRSSDKPVLDEESKTVVFHCILRLIVASMLGSYGRGCVQASFSCRIAVYKWFFYEGVPSVNSVITLLQRNQKLYRAVWQEFLVHNIVNVPAVKTFMAANYHYAEVEAVVTSCMDAFRRQVNANVKKMQARTVECRDGIPKEIYVPMPFKQFRMRVITALCEKHGFSVEWVPLPEEWNANALSTEELTGDQEDGSFRLDVEVDRRADNVEVASAITARSVRPTSKRSAEEKVKLRAAFDFLNTSTMVLDMFRGALPNVAEERQVDTRRNSAAKKAKAAPIMQRIKESGRVDGNMAKLLRQFKKDTRPAKTYTEETRPRKQSKEVKSVASRVLQEELGRRSLYLVDWFIKTDEILRDGNTERLVYMHNPTRETFVDRVVRASKEIDDDCYINPDFQLPENPLDTLAAGDADERRAVALDLSIYHEHHDCACCNVGRYAMEAGRGQPAPEQRAQVDSACKRIAARAEQRIGYRLNDRDLTVMRSVLFAEPQASFEWLAVDFGVSMLSISSMRTVKDTHESETHTRDVYNAMNNMAENRLYDYHVMSTWFREVQHSRRMYLRTLPVDIVRGQIAALHRLHETRAGELLDETAGVYLLCPSCGELQAGVAEKTANDLRAVGAKGLCNNLSSGKITCYKLSKRSMSHMMELDGKRGKRKRGASADLAKEIDRLKDIAALTRKTRHASRMSRDALRAVTCDHTDSVEVDLLGSMLVVNGKGRVFLCPKCAKPTTLKWTKMSEGVYSCNCCSTPSLSMQAEGHAARIRAITHKGRKNFKRSFLKRYGVEFSVDGSPVASTSDECVNADGTLRRRPSAASEGGDWSEEENDDDEGEEDGDEREGEEVVQGAGAALLRSVRTKSRAKPKAPAKKPEDARKHLPKTPSPPATPATPLSPQVSPPPLPEERDDRFCAVCRRQKASNVRQQNLKPRIVYNDIFDPLDTEAVRADGWDKVLFTVGGEVAARFREASDPVDAVRISDGREDELHSASRLARLYLCHIHMKSWINEKITGTVSAHTRSLPRFTLFPLSKVTSAIINKGFIRKAGGAPRISMPGEKRALEPEGDFGDVRALLFVEDVAEKVKVADRAVKKLKARAKTSSVK